MIGAASGTSNAVAPTSAAAPITAMMPAIVFPSPSEKEAIPLVARFNQFERI
jgi:hypothetical protein